MGIDIYATWDGMTEKEKQAQYVGYDVTKGRVGYLREAYHGDIYATPILCKEAFESENGEAQILASVLEERLEETLRTAEERERITYGNKSVDRETPVIKSYIEFVRLCKDKEILTGKPVTIIASY